MVISISLHHSCRRKSFNNSSSEFVYRISEGDFLRNRNFFVLLRPLSYVGSGRSDGGIGRHAGLKILWPAMAVRVRFPFRVRPEAVRRKTTDRLFRPPGTAPTSFPAPPRLPSPQPPARHRPENSRPCSSAARRTRKHRAPPSAGSAPQWLRRKSLSDV